MSRIFIIFVSCLCEDTKRLVVNHLTPVVPRITPGLLILCEMKEIRLSKSDKFAVIDDDDYDIISKHKWCLVRGRNTFYAQTIIRVKGKQKTVNMARFILRPPINMAIDHIDRNGLNNQKSNLRVATFSENAINRAPIKGFKYKGVHRHGKRFTSAIGHSGGKIYLGIFNSEIEAAAAYNEAAIKYFGEFAYLNELTKLPLQYKIMSLT